ncbi:hypothetical protein, partial [Streptomyces clavuligerus]
MGPRPGRRTRRPWGHAHRSSDGARLPGRGHRAGWDTEWGWEIARPLGGGSLGGVWMGGVWMGGFRDRATAGLDTRVLPRPAVTVVIGIGDASFTVEDATGHRPVHSSVAPPVPGPSRVRGGRVTCVELRLPPWAVPAVLGFSPGEPTGSLARPDDLWGRREQNLRERLASAPDRPERFRLLGEVVLRRAARAPGTAPEVAAVWNGILARHGRIRVDDLAAACGWSRGRPWSRFTAQIGLTPSVPRCWSASTGPPAPSARAGTPPTPPSPADTPISPLSTAMSWPSPGAPPAPSPPPRTPPTDPGERARSGAPD